MCDIYISYDIHDTLLHAKELKRILELLGLWTFMKDTMNVINERMQQDIIQHIMSYNISWKQRKLCLLYPCVTFNYYHPMPEIT